MSDWDVSASDDSDDDNTQKPQQIEPKSKPKPKAKPKPADAWDESDESEDEETKEKQNNNDEPNNDEPNNDKNNGIIKKEENAENEEANNDLIDAEKLAKLKKKQQKKQQNYQKKQKKKRKNRNKNKNKKGAPPKKQQSIPKNQDEIIEMSSDSDSDSDKNKKSKNNKMETYEDRMKTDNDILFEGFKNEKEKEQKKEDDRLMLSEEVTLKNFPLGSSKDCENFGRQIAGLLEQKLFEDSINTNDIFLFYKTLLSSNIIERLDMVDTKALCTKMNSLLTGKQKDWHKKKNPTGKKKKKPQWVVADKFGGGKSKQSGYVEGQYDADEYSLFD